MTTEENQPEAQTKLLDVSHLEDLDLSAGMSPLRAIEGAQIRRVLRLLENNRTAAARVLGIDRRTLYRKLRDHGIFFGARSQ